jgi:hypothetical protein
MVNPRPESHPRWALPHLTPFRIPPWHPLPAGGSFSTGADRLLNIFDFLRLFEYGRVEDHMETCRLGEVARRGFGSGMYGSGGRFGLVGCVA